MLVDFPDMKDIETVATSKTASWYHEKLRVPPDPIATPRPQQKNQKALLGDDGS